MGEYIDVKPGRNVYSSEIPTLCSQVLQEVVSMPRLQIMKKEFQEQNIDKNSFQEGVF